MQRMQQIASVPSANDLLTFGINRKGIKKRFAKRSSSKDHLRNNREINGIIVRASLL